MKIQSCYKNVLAKTVHTEILIFGPIEIGGGLGSKILSHKNYEITILNILKIG